MAQIQMETAEATLSMGTAELAMVAYPILRPLE